jgi:hypothetical protein
MSLAGTAGTVRRLHPPSRRGDASSTAFQTKRSTAEDDPFAPVAAGALELRVRMLIRRDPVQDTETSKGPLLWSVHLLYLRQGHTLHAQRDGMHIKEPSPWAARHVFPLPCRPGRETWKKMPLPTERASVRDLKYALYMLAGGPLGPRHLLVSSSSYCTPVCCWLHVLLGETNMTPGQKKNIACGKTHQRP